MKMLTYSFRKIILFCGLLIALIVLLHVNRHAGAVPVGGKTFLIQEKGGRITGISLSSDWIPSPAVTVRPSLETMEPVIDLEANPQGGYQLFSNGKILPIGIAKLPYAAWASIANAGGFAMAERSLGGWIAAGTYLKTIGRPPQLIFPSFEDNGFITDIEFDASQPRLAVVSEDGTIAVCTSKEVIRFDPPPLNDDLAIDLEISPDGFYILTRKGKIYHRTRSTVSEYPGVPDLADLAVDMELSPYNPAAFYILDVFGVIHACGETPRIDRTPLNRPNAVDLEIITRNTAPEWYPPGRHTAVRLQPELLRIDPEGPPKHFSIEIEKAEQLTSFVTQIRYDPNRLTIQPDRSGSWWGESAG